jgi:hypothetical protein
MNIMNEKLLLAGCKYFFVKNGKNFLFLPYGFYIFIMFIMFIADFSGIFRQKRPIFWVYSEYFFPSGGHCMKKNEYLLTCSSQVGENETGVEGRCMNIDSDSMNIADSMFIGLRPASAVLLVMNDGALNG